MQKEGGRRSLMGDLLSWSFLQRLSVSRNHTFSAICIYSVNSEAGLENFGGWSQADPGCR